MTARPPADVVIPFGGRALGPVLARVERLARRDGDTLTVADNRGERAEDDARVVVAAEVRTSYFARNAGARRGTAPWIVFLDADVEPPPDLLDRLLMPPPDERVAVVATEVEDEPARPGDTLAVRYARLAGAMGQRGNLDRGFVATACCAVRRAAFEAAGGFRDDVRSGGDADLCFRLRAAGWEIALHDDVVVRHRSRRTLVRMLAQRARHGSGAAWMDCEHPGSFPARGPAGIAWWAARRAAAGAVALARGDRDAALVALLDGPSLLAFELGRRVLPNRVRQRR